MIVCDICPRRCQLKNDQVGFCGVRKNVEDVNVDRWYQLVIPKRTRKGYQILFPGCNLRCWFCSTPGRSRPTTDQLSKYQVIDEEILVSELQSFGEKWLYFHGGEPILHYEYVYEAARLAGDHGLTTMLVTSGYISEWLAEKAAKTIDYIGLGIKGSASPELYRSKMGADSSVCLRTMKILWDNGAFFDTSDLIGPGLGSPDDDIRFARWVCENIDPDYPILLIPLCEPMEFDMRKESIVGSLADARARVIATLDRFESVGLKGALYPQFWEVFGDDSMRHLRTIL